jgi:hypothetical protein
MPTPRLSVMVAFLALVAVSVVGLGARIATSSDSTDSSPSVSAAGLTVPAAGAGRAWAPVSSAKLGPGVQAYTGDGQCTADFVFVDAAKHVYLGQAAHCAERGESSHGDGCHTASRPPGTQVTFNRGGFSDKTGSVVGSGTLAYSSWLTMQQRHETNKTICTYNDFALVKIDSQYADDVNPTMPYWGGPDGLNRTSMVADERIYGYGNSSLRGGDTQLSPQTGWADGDERAAQGWSHQYHSPKPGLPGDSGSAFLDARGRAVGTLSTLGLSVPIVNATGDLYRELAYARAYSGIDGLQLVLGTKHFRASS